MSLRTSAEAIPWAIREVQALTEDPTYGITASTPWVWIVLGILAGVILIICAVGCYRNEKKFKAAANDPSDAGQEGGTINDAVSESGLDEPLL